MIILAAAPFVACSTYIKVNPNGFPAGEQTAYQGLIVVGEEGLRSATLTSAADLGRNETERREGRQTDTATCLLQAGNQPGLVRALRDARPDQAGRRLLWVTITGRPRYTASDCSNARSTRRRKRVWSTHLLVDDVEQVRTISCPYLVFLGNMSSCLRTVTLRRPAAHPAGVPVQAGAVAPNAFGVPPVSARDASAAKSA